MIITQVPTENYNYNILSMQLNESFIIYDCLNSTDGCIYRNEDNENLTFTSQQECKNRQIQGDKNDNICCYYRKKKGNENSIKTGCLEINKYEFQRFKWALSDEQFTSYENNGTNDTIIEIECNDKIKKINIFNILLILIAIIKF